MAAAVVSVPANEGISVKNEPEDPEINAMALSMKESFEKSIATARQQSITNIYINRAGRPVAVSLTSSNHSSKEKYVKLPEKDTEDFPSEIGYFGWEEIGLIQVPYIIRKLNGDKVRFVAVRVAENQLLQKHLHFLHQDVYACTCVKSYFISDLEAKLLNEINNKHSDHAYGKDVFTTGKDFIVNLDDVKEFHAFLETCYKKLLCNIAPGRKEKCGFIRINSESVVPYCIKDNHKYVPLFYFEGETENLRHRAIKLESWHLAYLKFCCKVQGIRNELFASDSCIVTSLDDIKNYFPPDTVFEEYWPAKVVDTQLLANTKTATPTPSGVWIRVPPPSENPYAAVAAAPATATAQTTMVPPPPPSIPLWPTTTNQVVSTSSYNPPAQQLPPPSYPTATRNQSAAAQYYNSNSTIIHQSNTPINNGLGHAPPPPLIRASLQSVPIANSGSYSNGSINHTTIYNPATSNVSHSNQGRQFYGAQRSNNVGQVQQQQQIINPSQQSYGAQSLHGGNTNTRTQQRSVSRNAALTIPASEIIDLSSPPSTPPPPPQLDSSRTSNNNPWTLKRIPENSTQWQQTSNAAAYKIQKATLQGKVLYCINSRPFIYSDLMLTLDDLVQSVFPSSSVATIAQFLQKYLKTSLYTGNSEQMAVLRENGRLRSLFPDDTPLAMLQDVTHVFLQLKSLIAKQDEQIQPYQTNGSSKRQRTS